MLSISRRGFVAGAVAGVAGPGARAATPGALTLTQQGRSVVMEGPDAARWRIDPMRSSPDSRADIVLPRRAADGETLTLDTGTVLVEVGGFVLPGGPLVRLEFRCTHHSSGWRVRAEWTLQPGGRRSVSRSVPLGGLSSGRTFDIPLGCQRMGELVRECAGRALQAPEAGVLEIDQALRVVLSARDGRFTGSGGVRLRTLLLAPAPAGADGSWRCDGVAEPVEGLLGRNREKTGVWLRFDTPAVTVRRSPKPLEIAGRGELAIEVPSRPAVKLPVVAARLGQDGAALDAEITLEQARGRLPTPLGTLDYEVGVGAPVATVSVRSGRIGAFRMELSAQALNLKVPDVDRSRLDFAGQRLAVRLAGLEEEGDGTGLVLGRGEPEFRIGLENASLQVFRGADLMQLTFRFSGMTLGVGTKEEPAPRITTARRPETGPMPACGPAPAVPGPILVVEFPPQHLLEQAFLHQDIALPDHAPALTAADIRTLQRPETAAARAKAIHKEKLAEEAAEGGDTPFASFSTFWEDKTGGKSQWLGPDGLLDLPSRQTAHKLVREWTTQEWQTLAGSLRSAATPEHVSRALQILRVVDRPFGDATLLEIARCRPGDDGGGRLALIIEAAGRQDKPTAALLQAWAEAKKGVPFFTDAWPVDAGQRALICIGPLQPPNVAPFLADQLVQAAAALQRDRGYVRPIEARLAGPSRLAFKVIAGRVIMFTAAALTRWDDFDLAVVQRAVRLRKKDGAELESSLDQILKRQGICSATTAQERMRQVHEALHQVQPGALQTALEVPARLVLSPAQDARWWVRPDAASGLRPVWQARMVERVPGEASLRAVWSPDFDRDVFRPGNPGLPPPPNQFKPFANQFKPIAEETRTAMDSADRHEIVALSSVHGLPVVVTKGSPRWPDGLKPPDVDDDGGGVRLPTALRTRRLTLSSQGASMDLDAEFEPLTAARVRGVPLFESYSLERWRSLIVDGRDVETTVVRRGYLFPLGHKAALVRTTEPRIALLNPAKPSEGYVVVQSTRLYLVARAEQLYPAPGQPNAGREFPARSIHLVTQASPDLLDASDDPRPAPEPTADAALSVQPNGSVTGTIDVGGVMRPLAGRVFWPRTRPGPDGTVRWRMLIDDGATAVAMPLLFVDHAAASSPETLQALCDRYYGGSAGGTVPPAGAGADWSLMRHGGSDRRYADETKKGDCSFTTDTQTIGVTGRMPVGSAGRFTFDTILQAAAQPPFYPVMTAAVIRPRQVRDLTGRPAPPMHVSYDAAYVREGFPAATPETGDAGQNFLRVSPPVRLEMGDNGDRGGGVARQAMEIAFLNRKLGPAGAPQPVKPKTTALAAAGASLFAAGAAAPANQTDQRSFIRGFFSDDAKLLGLIGLGELVEAVLADLSGEALRNVAPVLSEVTQFGGEALSSVAAGLRDLITPVREQLDELGVDKVSDLPKALDGLNKALASLAAGPPGAGAVAVAGEAWSAGQQVLHELDIIAQAPGAAVAALVEGNLRREIAAFVDRLPKELTAPLAVGTVAVELLRDEWGRDLLLAIPDGLGDADAAALGVAVAAAAGRVDWSRVDALQRLLDETAKDPAVQRLAAAGTITLTDAAMRTPLWSEIERLSAAAALAETKAFGKVGDAIVAVTTIAQRWAAALAGQGCAAGLALARAATAAIPVLPLCSASPDPHPCATFAAVLEGLDDAVTRLGRPVDQPMRIALGQWRDWVVAKRTAYEAAAGALDDARAALLAAIPAACNALPRGLTAELARFRAAREAVIALARDRTVPALAGVDTVPPAIVTQLRDLFTGLARALLQIAVETTLANAHAAVGPALAALPPGTVAADLAKRLDDAGTNLRARVDGLVLSGAGLSGVPALFASMEAEANVAAAALVAEEAQVLEAALLAILQPALGGAVGLLNAVAGTARVALATFYKTAKDSRKKSLEALGKYSMQMEQVLGPAPVSGLTWPEALLTVEWRPDGDALDDEAKQLEQDSGLLPIATKLRDGESAPQKIVHQVNDVAGNVLRASLQRLLDTEQLRARLEGALASMIPLSRKLTSSLRLPLHQIDLGGIATFIPKGSNGLELESTITAALDPTRFTGTAGAAFNGTVAPFRLEILKTVFLEFQQGVRYVGGTGRSGQLTAPIGPKDIGFGGGLSFLKDLAGALSMGDGQGPYARILLDSPAIEAGYRLSIDAITLGITFLNIGISVGVVLPFTNKEASFSASFGTIDLPVGISAGIYGGSCYLGFQATAKQVTRFDASFEFGGVAALAYGPLAGVAYVTTGAWVTTRREANHNTVAFTALFSAGFSAHIACFSVSASFVLRLTKEGGGDSISGLARLSFTFKVGFVPLTYTVEVRRTMSAGFGGGGSAAAELWPEDGRVQLASTEGLGPVPPYLPQVAELVTVGYDGATQWAEYAKQFDDGFRPWLGDE